jgi:hypothetical protein
LTVADYYNQTDSCWLLQSDWQSLTITIRLTVADYYNQTDSCWLLQSDWQLLTITIRLTVADYYNQTDSCWLLQSDWQLLTTTIRLTVADYYNQTVVLDTTVWDKVCQSPAADLWFSPGTPVSSTNKIDGRDILLKVVLNTHHNSTKLYLKMAFISSVYDIKDKKKTYYQYIHLNSETFILLYPHSLW